VKINNARFIIIGGGAVGCGAAYALARSGRTDILVLEQHKDLGQATTSQGAGLCGQVRDSADRIRLAMHSVATFRELQTDPVMQPDWHEVGSLRIALSDSRAEEFQRLKASCDEAGLETTFLSPAEAEKKWPGMRLTKAASILFCPTDGYMSPQRVVQAYEHQCRQMGVRFAKGTSLRSLTLSQGRVTGVQTDQGPAECEYVINAAGAHAYHVAHMAGLELPIIPVRHEYFVTVPMAGLAPGLPCFRVPELTLYGRVRDGGLLLGGWEPRALSTDPRHYSPNNPPPDIEADHAVLDGFAEKFRPLFPDLSGTASCVVGKGWPTFTPDGRFIIGESTRVPGLVMAGGCNAHGISGSGGIGRMLVESLFSPQCSDYVRSLSPDRFTDQPWDWRNATVQARKVYETYYA